MRILIPLATPVTSATVIAVTEFAMELVMIIVCVSERGGRRAHNKTRLSCPPRAPGICIARSLSAGLGGPNDALPRHRNSWGGEAAPMSVGPKPLAQASTCLKHNTVMEMLIVIVVGIVIAIVSVIQTRLALVTRNRISNRNSSSNRTSNRIRKGKVVVIVSNRSRVTD